MPIPVSELPMPADPRSQRQALLEKKSALTRRAQQLEESSLPPRAKQAALGEVRQKIDDTARQSGETLRREDADRQRSRRADAAARLLKRQQIRQDRGAAEKDRAGGRLDVRA